MADRELVMEVQLTVIDHLGINMYTSLPPVISEVVANAWDADSALVEINIPETQMDDTYEIQITDFGSGMTFEELNSAYLKVGRNRRQELKTDLTPGGRRVIGRKGIGKLSVFGVAKNVQIESIKDSRMVSFVMSLDDIRSTKNGVYKPTIIFDGAAPAGAKSGVRVTLRNLKRKNAINIPAIRRGLAQRFSVLGPGFVVKVNGEEISPSERDLSSQLEYRWAIDEEISPGSGWKVKGWVGTLPGTVRGEIERGIAVMARGKLIQEPTLFEVSGGKELAYAYMVGEIDAEFLDEKSDLVATHRSSIVWESEEGQALKDWGQKKLKEFSKDWNERRISRRQAVVRDDPEMKAWLATLSKQEGKVADRVINAITSSETLEPTRARELAAFMKESFQLQAFRDLAEQISDTPSEKDVILLNLFEEWQFLETKEMLRLFEGRLATIKKFEEYVDTNAKEIPTIHKFFKEFPWLLDPRWTDFQDEVRYSELLKREYPDDKLDEKDRRIDFMCIGFGDTIHIVELKRPGYKIKKKDLDQIRDYVVFVKNLLGSDKGHSYTSVSGYLVCGEKDGTAALEELIRMAEQNRIYVRRYSDLIAAAERLHRAFIKKYEELEIRSQNKDPPLT